MSDDKSGMCDGGSRKLRRGQRRPPTPMFCLPRGKECESSIVPLATASSALLLLARGHAAWQTPSDQAPSAACARLHSAFECALRVQCERACICTCQCACARADGRVRVQLHVRVRVYNCMCACACACACAC
eukprot:3475080-Pleurochrysis_carterae.AAC.1